MPNTNRANKVKFGLKNVHVAIQTKTEGEYTYATPVALPGAVSMSMDAQGETSPFYADNVVYYRSVTNNGYSGDLELALITDWFKENILNETKDAKGVLIETTDSAEPVYFALLFEFEGDQRATRHVLYNCTVSSRPTVESSTKEDTVEPGTETLSLSADPREDGLVKASTGTDTDETTYNGWYQSVYTPTQANG